MHSDSWRTVGDDDDSSDDSSDDALDRDFPLGDGVAERSGAVNCPYCGEEVEIVIDPGSGSRQEYVEDCEVCCRPWQVSVSYGPDGSTEIHLSTSDES